MAKKATKIATLSEMSGDKPRPTTLSVEKIKGESAVIEDVKSNKDPSLMAGIVAIAVDAAQAKVTPAEKKLSAIELQNRSTATAKNSVAIRAKYREMGIGLVRPVATTIDDVAHVNGVDAAYAYLLEMVGKPPLNYMIYIAVAFAAGAAIGAFTIAI